MSLIKSLICEGKNVDVQHAQLMAHTSSLSFVKEYSATVRFRSFIHVSQRIRVPKVFPCAPDDRLIAQEAARPTHASSAGASTRYWSHHAAVRRLSTYSPKDPTSLCRYPLS